MIFLSFVGHPNLLSCWFLPLLLSCSLYNYVSYFQGLNLLELTAHLEEKAAQLRNEGLDRIKIALAGMDTSSLLEILQEYFGYVDVDT